MTPITFGGNESEETSVTRAGTQLSDKVTNFNVWGYKEKSGDTQKVFPGYVVNWQTESVASTSTNTNGWDYVGQEKSGGMEQSIKYWDWDATSYRFFAVTNWDSESAGPYAACKTYGADGTYGPSDTYKSYNISMLADASPVMKTVDEKEVFDKEATDTKLAAAPYFSRLWYSTGNPTDYPDKQFGKPVTLEFLQPYARVRFIFKYMYPREGIVLSGISFKPTTDFTAVEEDKVKIVRKGTVTVIYPITGPETQEWFSMKPDADKSTRLDAFTEDFDPEDDTKVFTTCDNGWYTVLPNNEQGSYTLSVIINGQEDKPRTAVVPAEFMQWFPGYSYTYIFKITDEGGVEIGWVEYAVTPWESFPIVHTVYNW